MMIAVNRNSFLVFKSTLFIFILVINRIATNKKVIIKTISLCVNISIIGNINDIVVIGNPLKCLVFSSSTLKHPSLVITQNMYMQ